MAELPPHRMRSEVRVIFGDTDQMGLVYYANYLRYFEGARAAYWRWRGKSYKDIEAADIAMPVVEAHCFYKRPAHYEDLLEVETWVSELRIASLRFSYVIYRGDTVLTEGNTRHAFTGPDGRPRALPPALREALPPVG
ncbi:MAG TPA: thioesterase family protein [Kofleriaceae bacterium]|jgi:acyl-CoA thioester hydrolase|nr:thioesterase family protein [Kofleriaceae bacterium]